MTQPRTDAAVEQEPQMPAVVHNREPVALTVAPSDEDRPSHQSPPPAPWYVYGSLVMAVGLLALGLASSARSLSRGRNSRQIPLPEGDDKPFVGTASVPKTVQQYVAYVGIDQGEPKRVMPEGTVRTPEQCHALYIEGLEQFAQRRVWPEKLRSACQEEAPVETRWRAWLGESWDKEFVVRATGRTKGMALKNLLRKYKENGGEWVAHAVERSKQNV